MSVSNATVAKSLPDRISRASLLERLAILWPFLVIVVGLLIPASIYLVQRSIDTEQVREEALFRLDENLPSRQFISELKSEVASLKERIPPSALLASQSCKVVSHKGESGEVTNEVCQEVPASATLSLEKINGMLDALSQSADMARGSVRQLRLSMRNGDAGDAFADDNDFPTSRDKSNIMYTVLCLLIAVTLTCLGCLCLSKNPRVVTFSMETLKYFGGFYVGLIGSLFGFKK